MQAVQRFKAMYLKIGIIFFITLTASPAFAGVAGGGGTMARVWRSSMGKFLDEVITWMSGDLAKGVGGLIMAYMAYKLWDADDRKRAAMNFVFTGMVLGLIIKIRTITDSIFSASGALL